MTLTHIDLFAGIGGFSLAARWAGFGTVLHCEIDPYCQKVLRKNFPEVSIHGDIHTLDGEAIGSVDLITGGFPCQPFSVAGRRHGMADNRYLWPEMLRVVQEVRPTWVCGENVNGFIRMALDDVCADLETAGYEVQPLVFPACGVGAWHKRERVFIVAHRAESEQQGNPAGVRGEQSGRTMPTGGESLRLPYGQAGAIIARSDGEDVPDADRRRCEQCDAAERGVSKPDADSEHPWLGWDGRQPLDTIWQSEPAVCGMVDELSERLDGYRGRLATGVPNRVNRLRALGNAVVPQQAYPILAAIAATYEVTP